MDETKYAFDPNPPPTKWVDGVEYEWNGAWVSTSNHKPGITNTPHRGEPEGSRDRAPSVKQSQIGGTHYKDMVIQPFEFCHRNNIGHLESTAIGYLSRWRKKGGLEDVEKAIHALQYLIELEKGGA